MTDKIINKLSSQSALMLPSVCSLKIELQPDKIQPVIWRRLDVDGSISLGKLHHFIQAAFGWSDSHLHQFTHHGKTYGTPNIENDYSDIELIDERTAFLNSMLLPQDVFTYLYDLGDYWEHVITVENFTSNDSNLSGGAYVTDGARACPPEDVGGADGYQEFLELFLTNPHSKQANEIREWLGGDFNPSVFDKRQANAAICRIMYNKWGGK